jgi:hypothetical protein
VKVFGLIGDLINLRFYYKKIKNNQGIDFFKKKDVQPFVLKMRK